MLNLLFEKTRDGCFDVNIYIEKNWLCKKGIGKNLLGFCVQEIIYWDFIPAAFSFSTSFSLLHRQHNHLLQPPHHFKLLQLFSWYHYPNNDRGR